MHQVFMSDIWRRCLADTALVLLSNYLTTCQLAAGCSVADNPGLWLDSDPAVRYAQCPISFRHPCADKALQ